MRIFSILYNFLRDIWDLGFDTDREAENNPSPACPKGSSRAYNAG